MPVTVLELAKFRGAKFSDDGSVTMGAIEDTGLPFMGGCQRCGACVACYNSCPSTTGYILCANGCIGDNGYETCEQANIALFPEEYTWTGAKPVSEDTHGE